MTTRTLAVGLRALIVVGATVVTARAQAGFQEVLPPGTLIFLGMDDVRAYGDQLREAPLGRLWNDPACAGLRQLVSEQVDVLGNEIEKELGVDLLRLPALLDGPVALALLDLQLTSGPSDEPRLVVCMLADVGSRTDECRALLDGLAEHVLAEQSSIVRTTSSIDQTEVMSFTDPLLDEQSGSRLRYGLQGSIAVVLVETGGLRRDELPSILAGLKTPPATSLARQPAFAQSLAAAGGQQVRIWADLGALIERLHPAAVAQPGIVVSSGEGATRVEANGECQDERVIQALGLRDLGVLSMRMQCGPTGSTAAMRLEWPGEGWIPRTLRNFFQPGEFPRLSYVPAAARGVNACRIDLAGLFDDVIKLLIETGEVPPAELVKGLREAEDALGFNPRDDLLELFDGEFVFVSGDVAQTEGLPSMTEALNVAVVAGLKDPEQCQTFLDDLIGGRGLQATHKVEEYEGVTLHLQTVFPLPMPICYAMVDDALVLSLAPGLVKEIVHRRHTPDAPGILELPAYRDAVAALRPGYGLLGYSDAATDMKSLIRFLKQAPQIFGDAVDTGMLAWLADVPLPDESIVDKYFHGGTATALTVDSSGVFLESAGP
jgi:hypothetical protein